jgi:hypothetical protein
MDQNRFDALTKDFGDRSLSRRRALARGAAALAAGALAGVAGPGRAQEATPEATPDERRKHPIMTFVQTFKRGSIARTDGHDARYTVTLEDVLERRSFSRIVPTALSAQRRRTSSWTDLGFSKTTHRTRPWSSKRRREKRTSPWLSSSTPSTIRRHSASRTTWRCWHIGSSHWKWSSPRRRPAWRKSRRNSERPNSSSMTAPTTRSFVITATPASGNSWARSAHRIIAFQLNRRSTCASPVSLGVTLVPRENGAVGYEVQRGPAGLPGQLPGGISLALRERRPAW